LSPIQPNFIKQMKSKNLIEIAQAMVAGDKGILAMDESNTTCNKRFAELGIPQTVDFRRAYRELLINTPGLERFINAAILSDETIRQQTKDKVHFVDILMNKGIVPGIKVDMGTKDLAGFPGEKITEGLDGLHDRLNEYYKLGARFAKWRAIITIGKELPSWGCLEANAHALARYAALCQQARLVPIVEPEVLMEGDHSIQICNEATKKTLHILFDQLYKQRVDLKAIILKPNMVLAGNEYPKQENAQTVASFTLNCLLKSVPPAVPGIAFLSGGQSGEMASENLNAMHSHLKYPLPWSLTFSFGRALQYPAIEIWKGKEENTEPAQEALLHRALCNNAANNGSYRKEME
jgi:fructose-bisphosphate aldolase class I